MTLPPELVGSYLHESLSLLDFSELLRIWELAHDFVLRNSELGSQWLRETSCTTHD